MNLLKRMARNKYFYIFAILIIIMFPSTLYMQSDKDRTVVITTIGIDRSTDGYELSALAVIPLGGQDTNANLEIFEGKGETISEALENIADSTGKSVGLAHCDCIILSMNLMNTNIAEILDYFTRTSNLTTNATLVATDGKSKDLIEATKSGHDLLDLSLKTIVLYQEEKSVLNNVNIEKFYRNYLSHSSSFYMPILSVSDGEDPSSSPGGESSSEESSGGSGGQSQGQKKIENENRIIVLKNGAYHSDLDENEKLIYNIISPDAKMLEIPIDGVNDEYVTNSREVYQQVDKFIVPWYSIKNGKPIATYNVWMSIMIDEIESVDNHSSSALNGVINYLTPTAEKLLREKIDNALQSTIESMRTKNIDIMRLYEKFNAYHYNKWKKYLSTLNSPDNYLDGVEIEIKLHLNYVI